jgi:hypothetical protein
MVSVGGAKKAFREGSSAPVAFDAVATSLKSNPLMLIEAQADVKVLDMNW